MDVSDHQTPSPTPNWNEVQFDVRCARCDTDVKGQTDPVCPSCSLEFDWCDAVPIEKLTCLHCDYHLYGLRETRCPECGEWFTWEEVLDDFRRRQKPFFEYTWRKAPIRSFLRTWWLALQPRKLWSAFDIHDPPRPRPLLALFAISFTVFAIGTVIVSSLADYWVEHISYRAAFTAGYAWAQKPSLLGCLRGALMDSETKGYVFTLGAWAVLSFLALLIFRQSMRRSRVKFAHVLRVWAHAIPFTLLPMAVLMVGGALCRWQSGRAGGFELVGAVAEYVWLTVFMHATLSVYHGYRHYLRMPHSFAVAVSSQLIALLATAIVAAPTGLPMTSLLLLLRIFE